MVKYSVSSFLKSTITSTFQFPGSLATSVPLIFRQLQTGAAHIPVNPSMGGMVLNDRA